MNKDNCAILVFLILALFGFFVFVRSAGQGYAGPITMSATPTSHTHIATEVASGTPIFTSLTIGTDGTALTQARIYSVTIDPAEIAVATVVEQTYTVTGLATTDIIIVNKPTVTVRCGIVNARVSSTDTLALQWMNPLAALTCDPPSETYTILAIRQ